MAALVSRLTGQVVGDVTAYPRGAASRPGELWSASDQAVLATAARMPDGLRRAVVRLPACFRTLDQQPGDCQRLVRAFSLRHPDRTRVLLVVGVRSSGSCLAPLTASFLRAEGYRRVQTLTVRPGQDWLRDERRLIATAVAIGGLVLITDDPPRSGATIAAVARQLEVMAVPRSSIILLLQLLGPAILPARLRSYEAVLLPWDEWTVEERLGPPAVRETLSELLPGQVIDARTDQRGGSPVVAAVKGVRLETPPGDGERASPGRRHVRRLFRIELAHREVAATVEHLICVEGVGLGYFGEQALAVTERLADFLPRVYGVRDGLLYRDWLPEEHQLTGSDLADRRVAARLASYVIARSDRLPVMEDLAQRLIGRHAVWQRVADFLAPPWGGARLLLRPLLHRVVRLLLRTSCPCVIDANMAPAHWFRPLSQGEPDDALRKVGFADHAFSNRDIACFDPVFDLAGAAAVLEAESEHGAGSELPGMPRREYERLAGKSISDGYRMAVRASWIDRDGRRRPLRVEMVGPVLAQVRADIVTIDGIAQTDFMVREIDKGTGLQALAHALDAVPSYPNGKLVALAVGDSDADLPMFELATSAFQPAGGGVRRHPEAGSRASGKPPASGSFAPCGFVAARSSPEPLSAVSATQFSRETRLLLLLLAAVDGGKVWKLRQAAALGRVLLKEEMALRVVDPRMQARRRIADAS